MNEKIAALKEKVAAHKTAILATAAVVSTTVVAIQARGIHQHNLYLKEKNLYDDYYAMDEDD